MSLATPILISEPFGASAPQPAALTLPIPKPTQVPSIANAASFETGFPPSTQTPISSGGLPPRGQDLNGILYMVSDVCAYVCSGQPFAWDSAQASAIGGYGLGAVVLRSDGTGFWVNQTNNNSTNPDSGGAGWVPAFNYGAATQAVATGTVTLSAAKYAKGLIILTGALTGNVTVIFPNLFQQWLVVNLTTNAFTVTAATAVGGSTGTNIPAGGYAGATNIFTDGAGNVFTNAISTAGLAPINSPALTGVPTTPTAASTTNTTQIASTAMVQAAIAANISALAPKASPTLSGVPTAPTAAPGTNTAQLASTAFVQAAVAGTVSLIGNGYARLPGGLIIQWGYVVGSTGAPQHVTFPLAFPNGCFSIVGQCSPVNGTVNISNPTLSSTGFTLQNGASGNNTAWIAVGH